ncbi:MAG: Asp-tRNA(Asn)/Glu-tRNA(Gln) amidotransferase subunit GatC [Acidobacteriota bacterium]|nr:Asp-tRNA(Asn)/Glu-tRNA(Gln) amidotransferase subunit GatC [Acidobacteriota bacterium]
MNIDRQTVEHYAKLANLAFSKEETERMTHDFGNILNYVAKISELDLSDVEATTHVFENRPLVRPDETAEGIGAKAALANAPDTEAGHFLVPKMIKVR